MSALEAYLRGKALSGPMLGAQRRVEARIGQLLGEASNGGDRRSDQFPRAVTELSATDRQRFRILARGLERGLTDVDWRSAREPLLKKGRIISWVPLWGLRAGSQTRVFQECMTRQITFRFVGVAR